MPGALESPAPLRVWWSALALASLVAGAWVFTFGYAFDLNVDGKLESFTRPRIAAFADRSADAPGVKRVVLIGRSTMAVETRPEPEMEEMASHGNPGGVRFLRITAINQSLDALEGILHDVLDARPDLVVIESRLTVEQRNLATRLSAGRMYTTSLFDAAPWQTLQYHHEEMLDMRPACPPVDVRRATVEASVAAFADVWSLPADGPALRTARRFVREASARGIGVAIVTSPFEPLLEARLRRDRDPQRLRDAVSELVANPGVVEWPSPPSPPSVEGFCDLQHVTPPWSATIASWFIDQVELTLSQQARAP